MKKIIYIIVSVLFISMPVLSFAEISNTTPPPSGTTPGTPTNPVKIINPTSADTLDGLIALLLKNVVMPLAGVLVFLAILYSGFKFVTANGNPKALADAKLGLVYVLIGAAIILGAAGISAAIEGTFRQVINF